MPRPLPQLVPLLASGAMIACDGAPEACEAVCAPAAEAWSVCLEERGLTWEDAGWSDREAFSEACHTWAWELGLLAADARSRGVTDAEAALRDYCDARAGRFAGGSLTCDALFALDWDEVPWLTLSDTGDP